MTEPKHAAFDKRITPARPDLAASHLKPHITADRYVDGTELEVRTSVAPLRRAPDETAMVDTELLFGERFTVYETNAGWSWGQSGVDGYVGYLPSAFLGAPGGDADHCISVRSAHVYSKPDIKSPILGRLSLGSKLRVTGPAEKFVPIDWPGSNGFIVNQHVLPVSHKFSDPVAVAEQFMSVPYLWGGRSADGLDCSALVQLAWAACGIAVPRDADMQESQFGQSLGAADALNDLRRGDLIFWKGHVTIAIDSKRMVHANATAMAVSIDHVEAFARKIEPTDGPITSIRRTI